jgi:hypothetical protein
MKTKIGLSGLRIPEKITKGRNILQKMTGNPSFPNPTPSLEDLATAVDALETAALDAADGAKSKIAIRRVKEKEFNRIVILLAHWIELVSDRNEALILSTGFDVKNPSAPNGVPMPPMDLRSMLSGEHGVIQLQWKSVKPAYSYVVQYLQGDNPNGEWIQKSIITKASFRFDGLPSGQQFWFRVAAVGTSGQSGWSDVTMAFVP